MKRGLGLTLCFLADQPLQILGQKFQVRIKWFKIATYSISKITLFLKLRLVKILEEKQFLEWIKNQSNLLITIQIFNYVKSLASLINLKTLIFSFQNCETAFFNFVFQIF